MSFQETILATFYGCVFAIIFLDLMAVVFGILVSLLRKPGSRPYGPEPLSESQPFGSRSLTREEDEFLEKVRESEGRYD
tara:strand:- start:3593 stop:3829 length:237 start_codon:yes stop_codon:yes gene_type:complete